jgi:Flp pilus assembly protein TadG
MSTVWRHVAGLCRGRAPLLADQRGAVALEMPAVFAFLLFGLLLPLADLAVAGFQYLSAVQALRAFGQSILYSPPIDLSDTSSWVATAKAKADPNYTIPSIQLTCGDSNAACSGANTATPRYYSYSTTITLSPIVLRSLLCTSNGANPCTFTLSYRERFL